MFNGIKNNLPSEVVFTDGESWKKVDGYVNTYASSIGKLGLLNSKGILISPSIQQWKSSKGTYLYAKIISDEFIPVQKAVHQLVCKTYHGLPPSDGKTYEPNHKNGNKHDNHPDNLEWVTRNQNVQHAFDSGLCQAGIRIEVLDIHSKEIKTFQSLSSLSRFLNISRFGLRSIIANHRSIPYQGNWLFTVDDSSDKKLNRYQCKTVLFKDYVNNVIQITNTVEDAASITKVKNATITGRLNNVTKNDKLLSKYFFKNLGDKSDWPLFTLEEALLSEKNYHREKTKIKQELVVNTTGLSVTTN